MPCRGPYCSSRVGHEPTVLELSQGLEVSGSRRTIKVTMRELDGICVVLAWRRDGCDIDRSASGPPVSKLSDDFLCCRLSDLLEITECLHGSLEVEHFKDFEVCNHRYCFYPH